MKATAKKAWISARAVANALLKGVVRLFYGLSHGPDYQPEAEYLARRVDRTAKKHGWHSVRVLLLTPSSDDADQKALRNAVVSALTKRGLRVKVEIWRGHQIRRALAFPFPEEEDTPTHDGTTTDIHSLVTLVRSRHDLSDVGPCLRGWL